MSVTVTETSNGSTTGGARERLLAGLPVTERRLEPAGIPTAVLEGGEGPPLVLLHGPGESGAKWLRVIPQLVESHRVVAPDLPAHGASAVPEEEVDDERIGDWLAELTGQTCSSPPTVVGHVLGGAIAARFAARRPTLLSRLVLVDSLGLARFRPKPRFALTMMAFLARPSERSYERFMRQCSYDLDGLREEMGERWDPFVAYNLQGAKNSPGSKAVGRMMRKLGTPRIPEEELARIDVPTCLIWGREDRANRVRIAERVSERYGWPLHAIDDCADDPARDKPEEFVKALRACLTAPAR